MRKFIYIVILPLIVFFYSCSIKKRTYRNGYYIDWVQKGTKNTENSTKKVASTNSATNKKNAALPKTEVVQTTTEPNTDVASATNNVSEKIISPKKLLQLKDTCGDIINLRKGDIITAKVVEITETQIKYKRCNNIDGPLIVINKNDVYSVKYTNGYTDNFIKTTNLEPSQQNRGNNNRSGSSNNNSFNSPKQVHPLAWITLACTIGMVIPIISVICLIAALIIAPIAKRKILAEPDRYKGIDIIRGCQIAIAIILALALLLLILFLMFAFV